MKKLFFAVLLAALFLSGCKAKPELILYTWNEMFPAELLKNFEKETGIKIKYAVFDTNETMFARLSAAGGGGYDLVIADDYILETVITQGLAQKLKKPKLANYGNINPVYQGQFYDPADEYTVPYGAGIQTIVYAPERSPIPVGSYTDLWHPALAGSIGIVDSFRVINGMALKVLGQSYNTNDIEIIQAAGEYLGRLAPNIRLIHDDNLQDELLSGEISVAVMYTSQVTQAKMVNPQLEIVFPPEGIGFGIMAGFIPAKAPNPDAAYTFLDYILDAENGARCFEFLGYYSTNSASDPLIQAEYKDYLTLPENLNGETETVQMEMIQNVSAEAEAAHSRIWTEFKMAAGK